MKALLLNPNRIRILRGSRRNRITNTNRNEIGGASSCEPSLSPGVAGAPPSKRTHTHARNTEAQTSMNMSRKSKTERERKRYR
jgi:hypothetical protein